ncbi:hypothetical protein KHP62_14860 [Rhodobacteraceae bacterium NNCM2]|nr:hypothetical protein [Coraliihabitans acroporae]
MRKHYTALIAIALLSGCADKSDPDISGDRVTTRGIGVGMGSGRLTASHRGAPDGTGTVVMNAGTRFTCTARFDEIPLPSGRASSPVTCSNGQNGTATLRYDETARPKLMTYSLGLNGSGTVNF